MPNMTKDRATVKKAPTANEFQYVANASAARKYYIGTLQAVDANNRAVDPAAGVAALKCMGVVKEHVDNSLGAADAKKVELEGGEFEFDKHPTNTPTATHIGLPAYASDDHTISITAADGPLVGKITGINANSVDVGVGPKYF